MAPNPLYQLQVGEGEKEKNVPTPRPATPGPAARGNQNLRRGACYNCGSPHHYSSNCPEPRKQGNGAPIPLCLVCRTEGHMVVQCPYVLAAKAQVQGEVNSLANNSGATKKANTEAHVRFLEADVEVPDQEYAWLY